MSASASAPARAPAGTPAGVAAGAPATSRPDRVVEEVRLPNGRTRRDHYDLLGNLCRQEMPDDSWLEYRHDLEGRLRRVEHSSGRRIDYEVDAEARTWRARTERTETVVRRSADELPAEVVQTVDGRRWSVGYRRDAAGRTRAVLYPGAADWLELPGGDAGLLRCGERVYGELAPGPGPGATTLRFATGAVTRETLDENGRRLEEVRVAAADGTTALAVRFATGDDGRLRRVGEDEASYDDAGRLAAYGPPGRERRYAYDGSGRLRTTRTADGGCVDHRYDGGPAVAEVARSSGARVRFDYDLLGRRVARHDDAGTTRYRHDLFDRLERVELPDGRWVAYVYDGFGRLVARETGAGCERYVVGVEGRRLVTLGDGGAIRHSHLWLGSQNVGRVDGPLGDPLARTFHRLQGGRLAAVGDDRGRVRPVAPGDPYGAGDPIEPGTAGYAGLLGDPDTGLLHAGSRWLDPETGQFLTPDPWASSDPRRSMPHRLRPVLDRLPGGTGRPVAPSETYDWCARDPVNAVDPAGRNVLGYIWSIFSGVFWEWQLTRISLDMQAVNLVLEVLFNIFPGFRYLWDRDGAWGVSVANLAAPMSSLRQMVVLGLPLNGYLRFNDRGWTLGSVIWVRGDKWRSVEASSKRDLVVSANAADYQAARTETALDRLYLRHPAFHLTGQVNPARDRIRNLAVVPGGPAPGDVLRRFDPVVVTKAGADDAVAIVAGFPSPTEIEIDEELPEGFALGDAVEVRRLDTSAIHVRRDEDSILRSVVFVRGQRIHVPKPLPESFPVDRLEVTEYVPLARRKEVEGLRFETENLVLRRAPEGSWDGYANGHFLRVQHGTDDHAVTIELRRDRDLVVGPALPAGRYERLVVHRMEAFRAGAPPAIQSVAGQATAGGLGRVTVGHNTEPLAGLRARDGLEVEDAGAAFPVQRRIAKDLALRCDVGAVGELLNQDVAADSLVPDPARRVEGAMDGAGGRVVRSEAEGAGGFEAGQPVVVAEVGGAGVGHGVLDAVAEADGAHRLTLVDALPDPPFADGTAVRVTLLTRSKTFEAEQRTAAADPLTVAVTRADELRKDGLVRIREAERESGGVVRVIAAEPVLAVRLSAPLPAAPAGGLIVRRFTAVEVSRRERVTAPPVRRRLRYPPVGPPVPPSPFAVGDLLRIDEDGGEHEQAFGRVQAVDGATGEVLLELPVDVPMTTDTVNVVAVADARGAGAAGPTTAGARLDEATVLVPADPSVQLTRRRAFEEHELRHVWQGAVWGPFLLSLPIPWLRSFGWGTSGTGGEVFAHLNQGGLASLVALAVWGMSEAGDGLEGYSVDATIEGGEGRRARIDDAAPQGLVSEFRLDSHVRVIKAADEGTTAFTAVDELDGRRVLLRHPIDTDDFPAGEAVRLVISPFERVRREVDPFWLRTDNVLRSFMPEGWGQVVTNLFDRESWLPFLGIYPLSLLFAGFDEDRLPNEQDAAYHSGDLYTSIVKGEPAEIFAGQLSKTFAFIHARYGDEASGLSQQGGPVAQLFVELPKARSAGEVEGAARDKVKLTTSGREDFRQDHRVRVTRVAGGVPSHEFREVRAVDGGVLELDDPLPAAFAPGSAVEVFVASEPADVAGWRPVRKRSRYRVKDATRKVLERVLGGGWFRDADERILVKKVADPRNEGIVVDVEKVERPAGGGQDVTLREVLPSYFNAGDLVDVFAHAVQPNTSHTVRMEERVENAVAGIFHPTRPGTYRVGAPGRLSPEKDIVFTRVLFGVGFLDLRNVRVKPVRVTPDEVYETEARRLEIEGDPDAAYDLAFAPAPPAPQGNLVARLYTAPANLATDTHQDFRVTARYPAGHRIFSGAGHSPVALTAAQRAAVCRRFRLRIKQLVAPNLPAVRAGARRDFEMPIAPQAVRVTSPLPAGATVNADVVSHGGRPARLTFVAPDRVDAATDVVFRMTFGPVGGAQKDVDVTVQVTP